MENVQFCRVYRGLQPTGHQLRDGLPPGDHGVHPDVDLFGHLAFDLDLWCHLLWGRM
jgi:hypothetical protein